MRPLQIAYGRNVTSVCADRYDITFSSLAEELASRSLLDKSPTFARLCKHLIYDADDASKAPNYIESSALCKVRKMSLKKHHDELQKGLPAAVALARSTQEKQKYQCTV